MDGMAGPPPALHKAFPPLHKALPPVTLPTHHPPRAKMRSRLEQLVFAGSLFAGHLFVIIRYASDAQGGLYSLGREVHVLQHGQWVQCFQGIEVPRTARLTSSQKASREIMVAMGPAIKTKASGELERAYVFRKFLDMCHCSTDTIMVYDQLKSKGLAKGCKILTSARTGRGGKRTGKKQGGVWMASWNYLEQAYPHIMSGFL